MGEVSTLTSAVLTQARAIQGLGAKRVFEPDWIWCTAALSVLVAVGYCVIAFNWYFQSRLGRPSEARGAVVRLCGVLVVCAVVGCAFYLLDMPWPAWRLYDVMLVGIAIYTWSFALRTKGFRLVDERLAQMVVLERSAQTYREIAELLPQAIWTASSEGVIDFSNKAWSDYAGRGNVWLDSIHPDEEQDVLSWWYRAVRDRVADRREMRLRGVDKGYRAFVVSAVPVAKGAAVKWLGACADIEDQRQIAAEKERQAKQKMFFLNALSHDIRAPLNSILLNAQALTPASPEDRAGVETIIENAMDAANLVGKLLDFAKIGSQDHNDIQSLSVKPLLNHVWRRFLPIAERKGLYLNLASAPDLDVVTDRFKLERVVSNLIDNAIKFTDVGGVDVRGSMTGDRLVIQVSDTGIGIPEKDVPHLFDEFYQAEKQDRERNKGFGLGLAICRTLMRQIGGDVRLVQTGAAGTSFEVTVRVETVARGAGDTTSARGLQNA